MWTQWGKGGWEELGLAKEIASGKTARTESSAQRSVMT